MRECENQFLELLKREDYDPKELYSVLSDVINSFQISTDEIIEEIERNKFAKIHMDRIS